MRTSLLVGVAAILVLPGCAFGADAGRDADTGPRTSIEACSLTPVITFDGKQYISVRGPGNTSDDKRKGERLGTGTTSACDGDSETVDVYRVRGLAVEQAVYAAPAFGLMERWNQDGSIK